jgi:hypothetical protein
LASTPLRPQLPPAGSFLLLAAAVLSYIPYLLAILAGPTWGDTGGEARYGVGWAILFALFFGSLLWFAIGGMVLLAWRRGHLPAAFAAATGILYPLAAIATFAAAQSYFTWPGGLSILVPTLLPPLLAVYALLARFSTFGTGPARAIPAVALGGVALLALGTIPFAYVDKIQYPAHLAAEQQRMSNFFDSRYAESAQKAREWEGRIRDLGPDSPLAAWLEYVYSSSEPDPLHRQALDGARRVESRQSDAVQLLDDGKIQQLQDLWQLDLAATPSLCAAYDRALHRLATMEYYDLNVGAYLERQVPNIEFLAAAHCDLDAGLAAAEARLRKIIVVNQGDEHWARFLASLAALRRAR